MKNIYLLKIDMQQYELKILRRASSTAEERLCAVCTLRDKLDSQTELLHLFLDLGFVCFDIWVTILPCHVRPRPITTICLLGSCTMAISRVASGAMVMCLTTLVRGLRATVGRYHR